MTTEHKPDVIAVWAEAFRADGAWIMGDSAANGLPWLPQPTDLRHFREATRDRVMVMGRKTFESLPESLKTVRALKERPMLVLTRDMEYLFELIERYPDAGTEPRNLQPIGIITKQPADMLDTVARIWPGKDAAVIGGPAVLELFEPYYSRMLVSSIEGEYDGDVLAPDASIFSRFRQVDRTGLAPDYTTHVRTYLPRETTK